MNGSFDLTSARVNRGKSRSAMAAEIGVSIETIRRVETGERPTPRIGKKIADYFDLQVTDLWPVTDRPTETVAS